MLKLPIQKDFFCKAEKTVINVPKIKKHYFRRTTMKKPNNTVGPLVSSDAPTPCVKTPQTAINCVDLPNQQHLLFLFFPLKKGALQAALEQMHGLVGSVKTATTAPQDNRAATGVHYFMFYGVEAGSKSTLPVPSFQTAEGKDLLVVMSIYDSDFTPYISAFTGNPLIAAGLDAVVGAMDESGIKIDDPHTSAEYIGRKGGGGVAKNSAEFIQLLMRYNFSDPTIPGSNSFPVNTPAHPKFIFGATFPGLTVGSILQNYTDENNTPATTLYPFPPVPITFTAATK
jgi:hypothetical protein